MDALSVLLQNVHLFQTKYYRLNGVGNWSYSLERKDVILFYLVLSGSFYIDVGSEKRTAHAGSTIMISNANKHTSHAIGYHDAEAKPLDELLNNYTKDIIELNDEKGNDIVFSTNSKEDINFEYDDNDDDINVKLIMIECRYDKEMLRPLLSVLPSMLPELNGDSAPRFGVIDVEVRLLTLESEHERMGRTAIANHWASIMLIECLRTYIESLPEMTENWLYALKDPYLSKALAAMHEAPEQKWTINSLAGVAGMSRSSFAERFKDVVGIPPLTYLIDYRLRLAARYLRLQQNSISRISEMVGYASDSTFSQAFKRVYGISPKAYRQRYQSSLPAA